MFHHNHAWLTRDMWNKVTYRRAINFVIFLACFLCTCFVWTTTVDWCMFEIKHSHNTILSQNCIHLNCVMKLFETKFVNYHNTKLYDTLCNMFMVCQAAEAIYVLYGVRVLVSIAIIKLFENFLLINNMITKCQFTLHIVCLPPCKVYC